MKDVLIIGGGLAGLINAVELSKSGLNVLLLEKKEYPFHRVCGEYVSNEVIPYLKSIECFPDELSPAAITHFQLTAVDGQSHEMPLDLGAFGISRYALDHYLVKKAKAAGAEIREKISVEEVTFLKEENLFQVIIKGGETIISKMVIGAFGKRSTLDTKLERPFITRRSPYVGIKYHIKTDFDAHKIALHNFKGGYCGISQVEDDTFNLCYLAHRSFLKQYGTIELMEKQVVCENPHLRNIWQNSEFIFDKPMVINEISFEKKLPVEQHILMSGDAAGMITPLCGNGMAMAIHSAKILSGLLINKGMPETLKDREKIEEIYSRQWQKIFSFRLWVGRNTQKLFGGKSISKFAVKLAGFSPGIASQIMKRTHGEPF